MAKIELKGTMKNLKKNVLHHEARRMQQQRAKLTTAQTFSYGDARRDIKIELVCRWEEARGVL
jgi:hypothetical protein